MIRALLIDDEHFARQALKNALEQYCPQIQLLQSCESPQEGIAAIRKHNPELVFLDVQMPGMSGFDLLKQLEPVAFDVIFITAYDRYAIKAIRFSAVDYLMKPLDVDDLMQAVKRVQERQDQGGSAHRLASVIHNLNYKSAGIDKLAVPTLEGIDFIDIQEIIFCQADGGYTTVYLADESTKLISRTLKDFENLLSESGFCRVHHRSLINMQHIKKYIKGEGGYVILTHDHQVDISRRKKDEFIGLLDKL